MHQWWGFQYYPRVLRSVAIATATAIRISAECVGGERAQSEDQFYAEDQRANHWVRNGHSHLMHSGYGCYQALIISNFIFLLNRLCLVVSVIMGVFAHFYNVHLRARDVNDAKENPSGANDQNNNRTIQLHSMDWLIQCFSLTNNFNMITSTGKPPNAIPVVDGLKWVILPLFNQCLF